MSVKVTPKKGTTTQKIKTAWDVDAKTLTITTPAKMTAGTYELTVTDKNDATKTTSKTVDVTAQKATTITILNDVALTGEKTGVDVPTGNSQLAYVYYDVLDQYGTSMRSSVSVDWSSSVKVANKNAATGLLTLERTDGKDFTYGEQIFITGVNTKTGLNVNKTLTVGANNASATASVNGAELGDTFTLVGFYGTLSAKVAVTVGVDSEAKISSKYGNVYLDTLVNGTNGLEAQRVAGLK